MMNKKDGRAYIVDKYSDMHEAYTTPRLIAEAGRLGIDLDLIGVQDAYIDQGRVIHKGRVLDRKDFVLIRQKSGHLRDLVCQLADLSFNPLDKLDLFKDKYNQYRLIQSQLVAKPKSILAYAGLAYESLLDNLGSPFVAKGLKSSEGREVYLIETKADYEDLVGIYQNPVQELLFQEFIGSSLGRDLRIMVIKGEAVACMQRSSQDSFKANFALGGKVQAHPIDDQIRAIAREVYRQTGLFFFGLDLLFGPDAYLFCELNITPGIRGIELATGQNIAGAIIAAIRSEVYA